MDCQWQEGGDALSGSGRNSLVIWWSPQKLIKLRELFSEKTSKKQKLLSLTTWRVYNVKGNFAYLESLKTVNPPSPLQTTALPQTRSAQSEVQIVVCRAVNSYWGNIIVQIFQNYFGTSNSEVNNVKHMREPGSSEEACSVFLENLASLSLSCCQEFGHAKWWITFQSVACLMSLDWSEAKVMVTVTRACKG